jgi:hypothetical protein
MKIKVFFFGLLLITCLFKRMSKLLFLGMMLMSLNGFDASSLLSNFAF